MHSPLFALAEARDFWQWTLEILLLLAAAMVLGAVAERLRQSAIVGYLIAGAVIGPNMLGVVAQQQDLFAIAELGVALLLFTIGLEFAPQRLWGLGRLAFLAGLLQVPVTMALATVVCRLAGMPLAAATVVGAMVAMSSTACVLRILADRAEMDSPHGRICLGILLVQDAAVVPLLVVVTVLSAGKGGLGPWWQLGLVTVSAFVLAGVFYVLFARVAPRLMQLRTWLRNRDLPILLAIVMALGSTWAAHQAGLSPALGAFLAGALLAASPFAVQIRADVEPVKTILVTLFFASMGMFGDFGWLLEHAGLVFTVVAAVILGKAAVVAAITRLIGAYFPFAVASGLCVAQIGEFSFVLATVARGENGNGALLSDTAFRAIVSATLISLLVTPYLIAAGPRLGYRLHRAFHEALRRLRRRATRAGGQPDKPLAPDAQPEGDEAQGGPEDLILVVGFGPAGQRAAEQLAATCAVQVAVLDLNIENVRLAERCGLAAYAGDATQVEVLQHAGLHRAAAVIVTVPTPRASRRLIALIRHHAPAALIVARARYHIHRWQLVHAGAHVVVDEEDEVGHHLAAALVGLLEGKEGD